MCIRPVPSPAFALTVCRAAAEHQVQGRAVHHLGRGSRLEGRVQVARVGYCDLFICYVISCVVVL
eukprot:scaffold64974_cov87-Phaeocystis_antarctica.AAC.1